MSNVVECMECGRPAIAERRRTVRCGQCRMGAKSGSYYEAMRKNWKPEREPPRLDAEIEQELKTMATRYRRMLEHIEADMSRIRWEPRSKA